MSAWASPARARNRIANAQLHAPVDGAARMDAVFYMQGAMDTFAQKSRQELGRIVMEIAQRGQSGLQINEPEVRYTLKSPRGMWVAEVPIKPKGISTRKRTIGTPEFRHFTEVEGRFANLLPAKGAAGLLH